jgi:hypothetical protein
MLLDDRPSLTPKAANPLAQPPVGIAFAVSLHPIAGTIALPRHNYSKAVDNQLRKLLRFAVSVLANAER